MKASYVVALETWTKFWWAFPRIFAFPWTLPATPRVTGKRADSTQLPGSSWCQRRGHGIRQLTVIFASIGQGAKRMVTVFCIAKRPRSLVQSWLSALCCTTYDHEDLGRPWATKRGLCLSVSQAHKPCLVQELGEKLKELSLRSLVVTCRSSSHSNVRVSPVHRDQQALSQQRSGSMFACKEHSCHTCNGRQHLFIPEHCSVRGASHDIIVYRPHACIFSMLKFPVHRPTKKADSIGSFKRIGPDWFFQADPLGFRQNQAEQKGTNKRMEQKPSGI